MSELIVAALKIAFLVLMWVFILFAVQVVRTDMWGRQVAVPAPGLLDPPARTKRRRPRRNTPQTMRVIEGRQAGQLIPMAGVVGIGRVADSALQIDDDYASTRHAQLTQDSDGYWVLDDLNSTNGTFLNGTPVREPVRVKVGDQIRIGRTVMRLEKS